MPSLSYCPIVSTEDCLQDTCRSLLPQALPASNHRPRSFMFCATAYIRLSCSFRQTNLGIQMMSINQCKYRKLALRPTRQRPCMQECKAERDLGLHRSCLGAIAEGIIIGEASIRPFRHSDVLSAQGWMDSVLHASEGQTSSLPVAQVISQCQTYLHPHVLLHHLNIGCRGVAI